MLEAFPDAGIRGFPGNKRRSVSNSARKKQTTLDLTVTKKPRFEKFNISRVKQALLYIMTAQSSRTTENENYRGFVKSLAPQFDTLSEKTEKEEEKLIYGLCVSILKNRLRASGKYFPIFSRFC